MDVYIFDLDNSKEIREKVIATGVCKDAIILSDEGELDEVIKQEYPNIDFTKKNEEVEWTTYP